jgi:uncharacterized membrane protein YgcG
MRRLPVLSALIFVFVSASALAQGRQLYWDTLSVKARLEADGRLQVEERQSMVFTGDWNGGERTFNIRPRQGLTFGGMSRIDPQSGVEIPMHQGSLDEVDQWDWADSHVLRWRARKASDPAFDNTTITYLLRYSLTRVLKREHDQFVLDHDFAFPDRQGAIEHFRLDLTLDSAWQTFGELQKTWSVQGIPPGRSFVLRVPLRYAGPGEPVADSGLGQEVRMMLMALALVPLLLLGYALLREKMLGRLQPPQVGQISRPWLEQNLLRERPEVIGAMWDDNVGAAEVSAALARMVAEGRLESKVEGGEMELTILTRKDLNDYEQALLDGLFFSGDHTSTAMIRKHYAGSGFNPAAKMAEGLKRTVQERLPKGEPAKPSSLLANLLFFVAVAALVYAVKQHSGLLKESAFIFFGGLFVAMFATMAPNYWRVRKSLGIRSVLLATVPAAIVAGAVAFVVWRSASLGVPDLPMEMQLALTLLALWIFATSVQALRSRESRESIAFLKMLSASREYFRQELRKERPSLDDAWYPYVLAFGLSRDVERWFRSFPGAATLRDNDHWSSGASSAPTSSSGSSFSPSTWTGGGGAFGGAGATGIWALAAAGMAAGVAAPSSSSGSGGSSSSSSSGGSSGGGGGGGW